MIRGKGRAAVWLLVLALLMCAGAEAEEPLIRESAMLNHAFTVLEEGNPFVERYNRITGQAVTARMAQGAPYFWGAQEDHLFAKEPEYVVVPAGQILPVPSGTGLVEAAALPEVAATVWSNLFMLAGVSAGDWVLIHGGAGGIGTMATQLVAAAGAHPVVTAGSPEKLEYCTGFGAEAGIDYRTEDFVERMREISGGHGADVVLDVVGAKYLDRNVHALATGGRLVVIGLQGGAKAELDLRLLMTRRASVAGTTLRARPVEEKSAIVAEVAQHVWPLVEAGRVRAAVEATYPLERAAEAHEYFDSGSHTGKILLTV